MTVATMYMYGRKKRQNKKRRKEQLQYSKGQGHAETDGQSKRTT